MHAGYIIGQADASNWQWLLNQGFAVAVVFTLGYVIYKLGIWVGGNIFIPIRDAGIAHLQTTTDTMREIGKTLTDQHAAIKRLDERIGQLDLRIGKINDSERT